MPNFKSTTPIKEMSGSSVTVTGVKTIKKGSYGPNLVCSTSCGKQFWANTSIRKHFESSPSLPFNVKFDALEQFTPEGRDTPISYVPVEITV